MKSRRNKAPGGSANRAASQGESRTGDSGAAAAGPTKPSSPQTRWGFRIAALLLPLVLVLLAELGLRVAGFGYPTSFLRETQIERERVLVENPKFGWRFFPPRLARTPEPLAVARTKPPGMTRIVVFGESAAMGDPEPAFGFARQLEVMLQARHPDKRFEVINVAMTAINSHVIREIARDCQQLKADCWIVYAGNNEVVGPYGAGTVFGRQAPRLGLVRLAVWVKKTRLGQWLSGLGKQPALPARWEGMELFLDQQVPAEDPRRRRVYVDFSANLEAILKRGRSSGAKVLATTVPVNLKDSPPFASQHRPGLTEQQIRDWDKAFAAGREAEQRGRTAEALQGYTQAAKIDDMPAELIFRRAACELAEGYALAAGQNFMRACDHDTLRFRADGQINEAVRRSANNQGARLVDAEKNLVSGDGASGIPGEEVFYDHVHLNFHGSYLLASLFVPEIELELYGAVTERALLKEEEVAQRLAFTDFERRRVFAEMRARLQQPPFTAQSNFKERDERWRQTLESLAGTSVRDALPEYREALAARTNDWVLHALYARALEGAGEPSAAAVEWQAVVRLMPHEPDGWFQLGNLALASRNFAEAQRLFQEVLKRNPASTDALNSLGLAASGLGQKSEAKRYFDAALKLDPQLASARINLAVMLANSGDTAAAAAEYTTVLRQDTNNVAARVNLARLLAADGKTTQALSMLKAAVALQPGHAVAQYDLGNALSGQQQYAQAITHYFAAVKARPEFVEARYNLAIELARAGRMKEAATQFAETVRLKPDFADAHFNYGIALARLKRYEEAVSEFKKTLELNPQHSAAGPALERAAMLADAKKAGAEVTN